MDPRCRQRHRTSDDHAVSKPGLLSPEQQSATLADQTEGTLRIKLAILEQQLVESPFFGGGKWDMADLMIASVLYVLTRLELDLTRCLADCEHQQTCGSNGTQTAPELRPLPNVGLSARAVSCHRRFAIPAMSEWALFPFWHLSDIRTTPRHVCFRIKNRRWRYALDKLHDLHLRFRIGLNVSLCGPKVGVSS